MSDIAQERKRMVEQLMSTTVRNEKELYCCSEKRFFLFSFFFFLQRLSYDAAKRILDEVDWNFDAALDRAGAAPRRSRSCFDNWVFEVVFGVFRSSTRFLQSFVPSAGAPRLSLLDAHRSFVLAYEAQVRTRFVVVFF
jgi:hypothetical protein